MKMPARWLVLLAFLLSVLLSGAGLAGAAEPPTEPILRLAPNEHTATIPRIATDDQGRWLATASHDKTVRVWSLVDGRLSAILRPPIGPGHEGHLRAVALSPDGALVAAGGATQFGRGATDGAQDDYSIYLFDRAGGRMLRRLPGLTSVVLHLAFSPDGRWLAAMVGDKGLRIFAAADGRLLASDDDYRDASFSVQFSHDGKLVTTALDGLLRLYRFDGRQLRLLAKRAAPGGKEPHAARFSPDGRRIAVGFADTPAVNVLDGEDLTFRFAPDTAQVDAGLSSIAWSRDGAVLFAAGQARQGERNQIRRWAEGGRGAAQDWPVAASTIMDLAALPGGRLAFGSAEPAWGVADAAGRIALHHAPVSADLRGSLDTFRLSRDGTRVGFGYEYLGQSPTVFDNLHRDFLPADTSGLAAPLLSAPGLTVTDWMNHFSPRINGMPLALEPYEMSRSLALWPGGDGFVLGTEWNLRAYGSGGAARWLRRMPDVVWGVNVSGDGRWVVAAYGDGTIHWHRASDGAEQLAFFPHPDRKRWILWTPTGFYDAAPGAEDLIGWHVNRGKDQAADFFPASRFRSQFNRPDVIGKVLASGGESEALRLANAEAGRRSQVASVARILPPVVEILSPGNDAPVSTSSVTLRYAVRAPADAPVTGLRARVNGLAVDAPASHRPTAAGTGEITLPIPPQDSEIQLFAENRNGVSPPAVLRILWKGRAGAKATDEFEIKPKLYVLAVGVSDYDNPKYRLDLAAKDARDFAAALQKQKGRLYRDVEVKLLTDKQARRDDVLDGLDWLRRQVTAKDVGMLFLAGHGVNDADGVYYFLPADADADRLKRTGVVFTEIRNTLANLAGKALFFIDTCHSGNILGGRRALAIDITGIINELASAENGVVVFSSSTGRQYSLEDPAWGNGVFTKALVEGINGKADLKGSGRVTHKMLDFYLSERVKELTRGQQTPVTQAPGGVPDFPIALVK